MQKRRLHHLTTAVGLALCGVGLTGCPKKALYATNPKGGYTLTTATDSLDKAMIRFQRTAADLCPAGSYEFGEPAQVGHAGEPVTYGIEVVCTPP